MAIASPSMSLEEFLSYDDGTDQRYELENAHLVAIPLPGDLNDRIANFLLAYFLQQQGVPFFRCSVKTLVVVSGARMSVRQPDLMLLSEAASNALEGAKYSIITHDMPPPQLVVEVVSPGQGDRDYRHKRTGYAGRHISEYWIVDPIAEKVTILKWVDGLYEEQVYQDNAALQSPSFPALTLTAQQVLSAHL